ncbi:MAG: hypothetical protein PF482_04905 [Desulfobacteraceae bacterium]|jgi:hypothetical protein|nr:hypothetical protein [Desulfobacteraceae bacterium]
MRLPDEITLQEEIKEIANKIDAIINTVNQYYPMDKESKAANNKNSDSKNF